jgi:hypothetical protein
MRNIELGTTLRTVAKSGPSKMCRRTDLVKFSVGLCFQNAGLSLCTSVLNFPHPASSGISMQSQPFLRSFMSHSRTNQVSSSSSIRSSLAHPTHSLGFGDLRRGIPVDQAQIRLIERQKGSDLSDSFFADWLPFVILSVIFHLGSGGRRSISPFEGSLSSIHSYDTSSAAMPFVVPPQTVTIPEDP